MLCWWVKSASQQEVLADIIHLILVMDIKEASEIKVGPVYKELLCRTLRPRKNFVRGPTGLGDSIAFILVDEIRVTAENHNLLRVRTKIPSTAAMRYSIVDETEM